MKTFTHMPFPVHAWIFVGYISNCNFSVQRYMHEKFPDFVDFISIDINHFTYTLPTQSYVAVRCQLVWAKKP